MQVSGQVIKVEPLGKTAQQIKLQQVKNVRLKVVNLMGMEMQCFELYLDNAKSAVFAVDSLENVKKWVLALRVLKERGEEIA